MAVYQNWIKLMVDLISQIGVLVFGLLAVWLVAYKEKNIRKWGYLCALLSEPFWFITVIYHHQWVILISCLIYTWLWWRGFYFHWIKK